MNKSMCNRIIVTLSIFLWVMLPAYAQQSALDTVPQNVQEVEPVDLHIDYASPQTCEIAGIKVTGADNFEDFVLIGYSGLAVGDVVDIPGE